MSNYDLEEVRLLSYQMILSLTLIGSIIISLTLSYNEILKLQKEKPLYSSSVEQKVLVFNRSLSLLVGIGFLLINTTDKNIKSFFNIGNLENANLQINSSVLTVLASLIVLYVALNNNGSTSLENPEI